MPLARNIFGPDREAYRDTCRAFVEKHVVPNNEQWAKDGIVDREVWREAGRQGLLGIAVEERFGGGGVDDFRFGGDGEVVGERTADQGRRPMPLVVRRLRRHERVSDRAGVPRFAGADHLRRHHRDHERDHRP